MKEAFGADTIRTKLEYALAQVTFVNEGDALGVKEYTRAAAESITEALAELSDMERAKITDGWMLQGMDISPEQGTWCGWRIHANRGGNMVPVRISAILGNKESEE